MRRGAVSIAVAMAMVAALLVVGCGSGSSGSAAVAPHTLAESRAMVRKAVDSGLRKAEASDDQIACVDRNIEIMTARQFAQRLIEPAIVEPDGKRTPQSVAGALGESCF